MSDDTVAEEPKWLREAMLLAIHAAQIERYGGAHGVLDQNVVRSVLARPIHRWAYDEEVDPADFAAAYLLGFTRSQGFKDGNKRTGLASALIFLRLNGRALHVPGKELYALIMQVATDEVGDQVVAAYIRSCMEPV